MIDLVVDTELEAKYAKARKENAIIAAVCLLFVPALTGLFVNGNYRIGGMIGLATAAIPALLLRDRLDKNRPLALVVTTLLTAIGAYVNAFEIWVGALGAVFGFAAAWTFFRIKDNAGYRPRLIGDRK